MRFADIVNSELQRLGKPSLEGIYYEQFRLIESNNKVDIFEGKRLIATTNNIGAAHELIHTINSGC